MSESLPSGPAEESALSAEKLLTLVYDELRRMAANRLARENPGQTLQATALVHEVWLKLSAGEPRVWQSRAQFFAAAAQAMRRILIDHARRKKAVRHGGEQVRVCLDEAEYLAPEGDEMLCAIDEVLDRFAEIDPVKAELVKLRYFVGLTIEEASEVLGLSPATAKRSWAYARAWLFREINRTN
jgi:RNA polymerase sigma factor (TIGR02999 family)